MSLTLKQSPAWQDKKNFYNWCKITFKFTKIINKISNLYLRTLYFLVKGSRDAVRMDFKNYENNNKRSARKVFTTF